MILVQEVLELVLQLHGYRVDFEVEHVAWLDFVVHEVVNGFEEDGLIFGINVRFLHFRVHNRRHFQQVRRNNR